MASTRRWPLAAVALILFLPGILVVWIVKYANTPATRPLEETSIAVQPFAGTGDPLPGLDFAGRIRDALSHYPGLYVTDQGAFRLEGTVHASGGWLNIAVRVTQIVDGAEIWTRSYRRRVAEVSTVGEEIGRDVVNALRQHALQRRGSRSAT